MTETDENNILETLYDDWGQSFRDAEIIVDYPPGEMPGGQDILLLQHPRWGMVLLINGIVQLATNCEPRYAEMMAHVPVLLRTTALSCGLGLHVLIIGGGDGEVAHEVLKHPNVTHVTLVDIDYFVIRIAKEYLDEKCFDDQRLEIVIGNGAEYVATTEYRFDLVIVDSTDPIGPGEALFTSSFHADCARVLLPGGFIVTQSGVPFMQSDELVGTIRNLRSLYAIGTCYFVDVPYYIGGAMALGLGTDSNLQALLQDREALEEAWERSGVKTAYFNIDMLIAAFAHAENIRKMLEGIESNITHHSQDRKPAS